MADSTSIFYQIGDKVKGAIAGQATALLADANTWTGTNDFEKAVTVAYADGKALEITGTASTSDKLTAESLESTGDTDAKGGLDVTGNATISKDLTVNGNLIVSGTEAIIDTDSLDVTDNIIKLSDGASGGAYNKDSGLYFERGSGKSASAFVFDETAESFVVGTLEGSGSATLTYSGTGNSIELVTNENNQVTQIKHTRLDGGVLVYDAIEYLGGINTSARKAQKIYATDDDYTLVSANLGFTFARVYNSPYDSPDGPGNYLDIAFANGDISQIKGSASTYLAQYDWSSYTPPSGSNADIVNTTPAPLTVGSLKLTDTVAGATGNGKFAITINGPTVAGRVGVTIMPVNTTGFNNTWPTTGEFYDNTAGRLYYLPKSGDTYDDMVTAAGRFTPHAQGTHFNDATITVTLIGSVGSESPYSDYQASSETALSFTANQIVDQELGDLGDFNAGFTAGA